MGIEIKIKQSNTNIDMYKIEELWKKICTNIYDGKTCPRIGIMDEFYRMEYNFLGTEKDYDKRKSEIFGTVNDYILFDKNNYGSGIHLWFDNDFICMRISFPTTYSEIIGLYKLVNEICNECNTEEFYRENEEEFELVNISQLNWFIEIGINDTLLMLDRIKQFIVNNSNGSFSINGVVNPISITLENLKDWGIDLPLEGNIENITTVMRNYETFMNEIQQRDLFYAVFKLYKVNQTEKTVINGYVPIPKDCDTILPINPKNEFYFLANRYDTNKINNFYVMLENSEGNTVYIEYDEFLKKIDYKKREKYDGKHFIVSLSDSDIEQIIS